LAGTHLVRVLKDGYATCERSVAIVTTTETAADCALAPLAEGGQLRLEAPGSPGASVFVDRALVGATPWEGTLSPGAHLVWVAEGAAPKLALKLAIDPAHPRWPKRSFGSPSVTLFGGFAVGPGLGGAAEARCPTACGARPAAFGFAAGVRGAFRFPFGLALEI